jgi:hypothetical protein
MKTQWVTGESGKYARSGTKCQIIETMEASLRTSKEGHGLLEMLKMKEPPGICMKTKETMT